ncbi:MAG TPA: cell division protein SepF [Symbiobacteriaceae bacterium]|nr:cell division protein SepF [Symbiobacteriaceae bacterium]
MSKQDGLWRKLVDYLGFGPEEDEFEEAVDEEEARAEEVWPADIKRPAERRNAPVVPITAAPQRQPQGGFKVLVVEPRSFEEVQTIVDQMRARRPVILNLESLDKDLAQKILNFLNGAIYALNGETQRIAQGIFFFAPQGVDISTMGRGLTGTAIGGGAVDLPPGILEKLTGVSARDELAVTRSAGYVSREEADLLVKATGRGLVEEKPNPESRPRFDWRNK